MNLRERLRPVRLASLLVACVLVAVARPSGAPAIPNDDASIRHALNRLTFGPRPGDVARVKAIGLERWIDDQLTPKSGDNPELTQRLASFSTLTLDSSEIARQYIIPQREARRRAQLQQQQQPQQQGGQPQMGGHPYGNGSGQPQPNQAQGYNGSGGYRQPNGSGPQPGAEVNGNVMEGGDGAGPSEQYREEDTGRYD